MPGLFGTYTVGDLVCVGGAWFRILAWRNELLFSAEREHKDPMETPFLFKRTDVESYILDR